MGGFIAIYSETLPVLLLWTQQSSIFRTTFSFIVRHNTLAPAVHLCY